MKTLKAYAALVGAILTSLAGATEILPEGGRVWVSLGIAVATAVATWAVPNAQDDV